MATQSQYLAMALQQMSQPPQSADQTAFQPLSIQQMQKMQQMRQAWQQANPGQSYMGHTLDQMGSNLMGAPGRIAGSIGSLGQIPGQAANGLQALVQRFG